MQLILPLEESSGIMLPIKTFTLIVKYKIYINFNKMFRIVIVG